MKSLLRVLKNKVVCWFSLNFSNGKTTDWYLHCAKSLFMNDLQTSTDSLRFVSFSSSFLPDYRLHERGLLRVGRVKKKLNFSNWNFPEILSSSTTGIMLTSMRLGWDVRSHLTDLHVFSIILKFLIQVQISKCVNFFCECQHVKMPNRTW